MQKLYGLAKASILGDHSSLAGENKKLILKAEALPTSKYIVSIIL